METTDYKGFKINISQDEYPTNPIEDWDGNAKYALSHNRYNLQNDTDLNTKDYGSWAEFKQALIRKYRPLAILPVYMYDHSGQTIKTTPFGGMYGYFDSGQIGFVFVNKETLKEWGFKSRKGYEKATGRTLEDDLRSNVALYDDYITGNVWGFEVVNSEDEDIDSCWGFYGDAGKEEAIDQAKAIIDCEVGEYVQPILNRMKYKISITQADFITPKEFIDRYSKEGVKAIVEDVEFEGTDDVHTSGYTTRDLKSIDFQSLSDEIKTIFHNEGLRGECFGVFLIEETNLTKEIFTEDDFDWWN